MIATICEQPQGLLAAPSEQTGHFYVMLVCPDLSDKRVKLGFAANVKKRCASYLTVSPTARLIKSWPCTQQFENAIIDHVTSSGCRRIGREVFDFDSVNVLVKTLDCLFTSGSLPVRKNRKYVGAPNLVLLVDEEIREVLRVESAISGCTMAVIIEDFVKTQLADALAQIRARRAKREKAAKKDSP